MLSSDSGYSNYDEEIKDFPGEDEVLNEAEREHVLPIPFKHEPSLFHPSIDLFYNLPFP